MSAGALTGAGPAFRRGRWAGTPRTRDPWTEHDIRRKLTRSERLVLLNLQENLVHVERRLARVAARHHEVI